ncbi:MAG: tRNA-dihydrouridine synthase [Candidatus Buchananbacteria bacterium]
MKQRNFWLSLNKPILALAPMAGVSDLAFRQICKKYGADVVYTEMISADGLHYDAKKTLAMLKLAPAEHPVVIQLFGKRPEVFAKAAKIATKAGFDGIDLNFGCPAKKVTAHGGGVTLMRDLKLCRKIVETVCLNTKLPVSVKIRSSINLVDSKKRVTALNFIKAIQGLPVSAVMIHGRSYELPFSGLPDYRMIKKVKKLFGGIVLGNGGIFTPELAKIMLEKTGVDGLGLARGLYGRPWLFTQLKDYLATGEFKEFKFNKIKKVMLAHARLAFKAKGEYGLIELRKHLAWYVKGLPQAVELRNKLVVSKSVKDIESILKKF